VARNKNAERMSRSGEPNNFSAKVRCKIEAQSKGRCKNAEPSSHDYRCTTAACKSESRCRLLNCKNGCRYNQWAADSLCPSCAGKFLCYRNQSMADDWWNCCARRSPTGDSYYQLPVAHGQSQLCFPERSRIAWNSHLVDQRCTWKLPPDFQAASRRADGWPRALTDGLCSCRERVERSSPSSAQLRCYHDWPKIPRCSSGDKLNAIRSLQARCVPSRCGSPHSLKESPHVRACCPHRANWRVLVSRVCRW
jgi:hypothetical protein